VAGYDVLSGMYEWLMPDTKLSPAGSVAAFGDLVDPLEPGARILDCSCGTGQLAVGLAGLGLHVVATDASLEMVHRTRELADEHGVSLRTFQVRWDELPDYLAPRTFDEVFCVGNSLAHAEGFSGRRAALRGMSGLLHKGGRLVLTSRTWERVRAGGSRLDIWDRLVRRDDRSAVVIYRWQIAQHWEQEHFLEIAVAEVEPDESVHTYAECLSVWPFKHGELVQQLEDAGLTVEATIYDSDGQGYRVVAVRQ
jgi:SAM-dependent methyltransferase